MTAEEQPNHAVSNFPHAAEIIKFNESGELFFAVVGHIGAGISVVAETLKTTLETQGYDVEIIKASEAIKDWAIENELKVPEAKERSIIKDTYSYQDLGDSMREQTEDYAAVAQGLIKTVRLLRADKTGAKYVEGEPVEPDGKKRAYIFDSIRHPSEVYMLRDVYHNSFTLIGVVCQEEVRKDRLLNKFYDHKDISKIDSIESVKELMTRDSDDKELDHGQHVADAFFEADYFIDNTIDSGDKINWNVNEILGRLIDIVSHSDVLRPTIPETAMHHAMTAQIRSACLSRQVGAALVDKDGDIISTGTNEAPSAGGGVYGMSFSMVDDSKKDSRCFCEKEAVCSSTQEQNKLAEKIAKAIPALKNDEEINIISILRKAGLKDLLEFSRAIHAEMDAITAAARKGKSVHSSKMYVTTFPCHYCARHLVAAGVYEVQYIEPYPKSLAMSLHKDAITSDEIDWVPPNETNSEFENRENYQKVLFKPFVGVAPRLYTRAFTKDRSLKNKDTGKKNIGTPAWGNKWNAKRISYIQLEAELTKVKDDAE